MSEVEQLLKSGIAMIRAGRIDDALRALGPALQRAPENTEIQSLYGLALTRAGRGAEAEPLLRRAVEVEPGKMGFRLNLAELHERNGRDEEAARELWLVAAHQPLWAHVWPRLTRALTRCGHWRALAEAGATWLQLDTNNDDALDAVARGKFESGDSAGALPALRARRDNNPTSAAAQYSYGLCCLTLDAFDEAGAAFDEAERLDPNDVSTLAGKARLLTYLGRFAEAETYCRRCLQLDPENAEAASFLGQLNKGRLGDAEKESLERVVANADEPFHERIPAAFALARAYDAEGDIDRGFASCAQANALSLERARLGGFAYDSEAAEARTDLIKARTAQVEPRRTTRDTPMPIFIVGMPRSGTTLIESVLAAHSQICGKGELAGMRPVLRNWLDNSSAYASQLEAWAHEYLAAAAPTAGAAFFTDKMPLNFEAIGLIDRLFPGAPIVSVRRNALETGFSIFRQEFAKLVNFSNRLEDIAHAYAQYAQLMAHWRHSLEGRVITIQHEDFVANFDDAAPKLVRACGLEWEEGCRHFQSSGRAISTLSAVQVREPVSLRTAAARYARHLGPLREALERYGVDVETGALRGE